MSNLKRSIGSGIALTLMLSGLTYAEDARELTWDDLIPDGGMTEQPVVAGSGFDEESFDDESWDESSFEETFATPVYPTGVVEDLDGIEAKIPGFVVPLELSGEGKVKEFLLVPYFGACIHYPPPPPNQIVYVKLDEPIQLVSAWDPIWVTGGLKTDFHSSEYGAAGYTMDGKTIEEYVY